MQNRGALTVRYTNLSEAANGPDLPIAKTANQEYVNAKFNYIPALWYSNLAVQKRTIMKPIATNQEIMLVTGTRFLNRELCLIGRYKQAAHNSQITELERACWAGLIFELLPEFTCPPAGSKAFTWNVHSTSHFVLVNLGPEPTNVDEAFSVDPYHFINEIRLN